MYKKSQIVEEFYQLIQKIFKIEDIFLKSIIKPHRKELITLLDNYKINKINENNLYNNLSKIHQEMVNEYAYICCKNEKNKFKDYMIIIFDILCLYEKIKNNKITNDLEEHQLEYPKYLKQILNIANQNSKATSQKNIGSLSKLFKEKNPNTLQEWEHFFKNFEIKDNKTGDELIYEASCKLYDHILNIKNMITDLDDNQIRNFSYDYVNNLIINKTFEGMIVEQYILKTIALENNFTYKLSNDDDESKNIDGYLNDFPLSIKPHTYKLNKDNNINTLKGIPTIYYKKTKNGMKYEYDNFDLNDI